MYESKEIHQDFEGDPLAIDLRKSRKYCGIFLILSSILFLGIYTIGSFVAIPFLVSLCMANFFFHRAMPGLNFTQKVVAEFVGFFLVSLPTVCFLLLFMSFS